MEHTKEPWIVGDGHMGGFDIESEHDSELVAVAQTEHDARRIVACVNALANISTEWLEENKSIVVLGAPIADRFREIEKQRNELLAALEAIADGEGHAHEIAAQTIAKVKGGARCVLMD